MSRKEELPAEIQESREAALRKAVAETSEEDKTKLFPEFVKAQEAQGQKIETSDCQTPWQGLSLLDRLMWESTLADFARPRLFPEDIDEAVQRKLLETRVTQFAAKGGNLSEDMSFVTRFA
ncbi:hypothetical protein [Candidatus Bealeia paramacronuclearis]|uniref:hypothetical protein n=1 Tax=Candidatus Bealeia paramacronuclearis TaxID=1921001 RepID=UPI0030D1C05E